LSLRERLILIADDDPGVRDALLFALGLAGFAVRAHPDGAALLIDPGLWRGDCLVIDDHDPHTDAFELARRIRAMGVAAPIILMTDYATPGFRARAAAAGIALVLEKPLPGDVLEDSLRAIFAASGTGQAMAGHTTAGHTMAGHTMEGPPAIAANLDRDQGELEQGR
jgi:FixJ family two-component response regulator